MGLSTKYTWAEFYPGFMDIRKPVRHFTKSAYVPHYLYNPSINPHYAYEGPSPYTQAEFVRRLDEDLGRSHYYSDGRNLNYLHLIDRPLYVLPHRKSFYARVRDLATGSSRHLY